MQSNKLLIVKWQVLEWEWRSENREPGNQTQYKPGECTSMSHRSLGYAQAEKGQGHVSLTFRCGIDGTWTTSPLNHQGKMVFPSPSWGIPAGESVPAGVPWGHHSCGAGMSNGQRTCLCCTGWKWMDHWCWKESKTCSERVSSGLVPLLSHSPTWVSGTY